MSSSVIIWLTPLTPHKVIIWHRLLHTESISYVVFHHLAYSLTPYVIICHNLANPPAPQNDDVICEQPLTEYVPANSVSHFDGFHLYKKRIAISQDQ